MNENELIMRVKQKLASWKAKTLSKAGRLTVVQSNLTGMPNHIMSYFKCPHKLTSQLNRQCRQFFWGDNRNCGKKYLDQRMRVV